MKHTQKKWKLFSAGILLIISIALKYFIPLTSEYIYQHPQIGPLVSFTIFYLIVQFTANTIKYIYSRRNRIPSNRKNNVHFGIENIANFIIGISIFLTLLSLFGINPKEFITSLTIVAAAIAILSKEYIIDFLSGIYLSFSNTFEINDYVKINEQKGKILEIGMLKTKIFNDDDDIIIIPNSKVYYNEIINYTKRDDLLMTIDFQISLKYINNIEQLEQEIIAAIVSFNDYIEPQSYSLKVVEMKMDHLDLKFQYKIKKVDIELQKKIRKKTIREVFNFISSKKENSVVGNS